MQECLSTWSFSMNINDSSGRTIRHLWEPGTVTSHESFLRFLGHRGESGRRLSPFSLRRKQHFCRSFFLRIQRQLPPNTISVSHLRFKKKGNVAFVRFYWFYVLAARVFYVKLPVKDGGNVSSLLHAQVTLNFKKKKQKTTITTSPRDQTLFHL